jgi:hypothetical protein
MGIWVLLILCPPRRSRFAFHGILNWVVGLKKIIIAL